MIKVKMFHFLASQKIGEETGQEALNRFAVERAEHDKEIENFIEFLSLEGHTFMGLDSVGYGRFSDCNRIRTIITYRENQTRKVLVEKSND